MRLILGNVAHPELAGPDGTHEEVGTLVEFPDGVSLAEALRTVTDPDGVWAAHSSQPPTWVTSDVPALADALAAHYGCPAQPWEEPA